MIYGENLRGKNNFTFMKVVKTVETVTKYVVLIDRLNKG
jgi:hypothetical protein